MNIREYVENNNVHLSFANECIINELESISKNNDKFDIKSEYEKAIQLVGEKITLLENISGIWCKDILGELCSEGSLDEVLESAKDAFKMELNRRGLKLGGDKSKENEKLKAQKKIIERQEKTIPSIMRSIINNESFLGRFNILTKEALGDEISKGEDLEANLKAIKNDIEETKSKYYSFEHNLETNSQPGENETVTEDQPTVIVFEKPKALEA